MSENKQVFCPCGWSGKWWETEFYLIPKNVTPTHRSKSLNICPACRKEVVEDVK